MKLPLRVGIIGLGNHARANLIPALRLIENVKISAISSRQTQIAQKLADDYGVKVVTNNWEQIVNSSDVDAVIVAATPKIHEEVIRCCANRAVSAYVEKPPARNSGELRKLLTAINTKDRTQFCVGYNFRFSDAYVFFNDALRRWGETISLRVRFVSSKPREPWLGFETLEESFMFGVAIHAFDLVLHELGEPESVCARWSYINKAMFSIDVIIGFPQFRSAILNLGNYANKFEFAVESVKRTGVYGIINDQTYLEVCQTATPVLDRKERVVFTLPSSRGGFSRAGYSGILSAFFSSLSSHECVPAPLSESERVYRVIDQVIKASTHV